MYMCVYITHTNICIYLYIYICIYNINMNVYNLYMYLCMYICICIYIYIFWRFKYILSCNMSMQEHIVLSWHFKKIIMCSVFSYYVSLQTDTEVEANVLFWGIKFSFYREKHPMIIEMFRFPWHRWNSMCNSSLH